MVQAVAKTNMTRSKNNNFGVLARNLDSSMDMVVYRFAIGVQRHARINAPVRTGYLKSSIRATKVRKGLWHINVGASYGVYVEYGTRHMAPQPYFRPAIETMRIQMRADFKAVFKNGNQLRLGAM